jgi:hypothetical protein
VIEHSFGPFFGEFTHLMGKVVVMLELDFKVIFQVRLVPVGECVFSLVEGPIEYSLDLFRSL